MRPNYTYKYNFSLEKTKNEKRKNKSQTQRNTHHDAREGEIEKQRKIPLLLFQLPQKNLLQLAPAYATTPELNPSAFFFSPHTNKPFFFLSTPFPN